ncbi:hypothetical protein R4K89_03685 [Brachyspira intermedia]|uniref:hypothetical protein n=1 Tax=Brachyspira intermedia TaxID=84377 RepID=UPI003007E479
MHLKAIKACILAHIKHVKNAKTNTTKKILLNKTINSIFYFYYQMAIGGIKAINEYRYEIGKDIGVIGFDNL